MVTTSEISKKTGRLFPFPLKAKYAQIRAEVEAAVDRVFESQHFILGTQVDQLEQELARYVGTQFAIGCASGSDALLLALMALEIGPGGEVITAQFTFVGTAGSIARLRAKPVFVDIDPETYNLDPVKLVRAITNCTKAIMPAHLFGLAAEMEPILEIAATHALPVIEDAAPAIGASYHGRPPRSKDDDGGQSAARLIVSDPLGSRAACACSS